MKKSLIIFFAVFYLGISSGATMHLHFCMGQLIDLRLSHPETGKCSNCGMNKGDTKDCCKDQRQEFKAEKAQKASQNVYQFNLPSIDVPVLAFREILKIDLSSVGVRHPFSNASPQGESVPAFIRNCSYRI